MGWIFKGVSYTILLFVIYYLFQYAGANNRNREKYEDKLDPQTGAKSVDPVISAVKKAGVLISDREILRAPKGGYTLSTLPTSSMTDIKITNAYSNLAEMDNAEFQKGLDELIDKRVANYLNIYMNYEQSRTIADQSIDSIDINRKQRERDTEDIKKYIEDKKIADINNSSFISMQERNASDISDQIDAESNTIGIYKRVSIAEYSAEINSVLETTLTRVLKAMNTSSILQDEIKGEFKIYYYDINHLLMNSDINDEFVINVTIIVYRKYKNHGKEIELEMLYTRGSKLAIISDAELVGIVAESGILLLPGAPRILDNNITHLYKDKYVIDVRREELENIIADSKISVAAQKNKLNKDRGIQSSTSLPQDTSRSP
jgi:hypothetical protein